MGPFGERGYFPSGDGWRGSQRCRPKVGSRYIGRGLREGPPSRGPNPRTVPIAGENGTRPPEKQKRQRGGGPRTVRHSLHYGTDWADFRTPRLDRADGTKSVLVHRKRLSTETSDRVYGFGVVSSTSVEGPQIRLYECKDFRQGRYLGETTEKEGFVSVPLSEK